MTFRVSSIFNKNKNQQVENKKQYPEYKQAREKMIELPTAKNKVERILDVTENEKNCDDQQEIQ